MLNNALATSERLGSKGGPYLTRGSLRGRLSQHILAIPLAIALAIVQFRGHARLGNREDADLRLCPAPRGPVGRVGVVTGPFHSVKLPRDIGPGDAPAPRFFRFAVKENKDPGSELSEIRAGRPTLHAERARGPRNGVHPAAHASGDHGEGKPVRPDNLFDARRLCRFAEFVAPAVETIEKYALTNPDIRVSVLESVERRDVTTRMNKS